jgi:hypothetical protein
VHRRAKKGGRVKGTLKGRGMMKRRERVRGEGESAKRDRD